MAAGSGAGSFHSVRMTAARDAAVSASIEELDRLRRIVGLRSVGTWDWNLTTNELVWNPVHFELVGLRDARGDGRVDLAVFIERVHPDDREAVTASLHEARGSRAEFSAEFRVIRADDEAVRWIGTRGLFFYDGDTPTHGAGVVLDITTRKELELRVESEAEERRRLELQLVETQKMEAIGQLAGGVAHGFNNLLTVILGNLETVRDMRARSDAPTCPHLGEIEEATERARTLVAQLLAFSRRQVINIRTLDLHDILRDIAPLLRRALGESVVLDLQLAPRTLPVDADRGQLEQALVNLAVNARDAMLSTDHGHHGRGGTLTVATRALTMTEAGASWSSIAPGHYVELTLRDDGAGMTDATRERIFEPFFTTKPIGVGSGLGLSQVVGIIEQCGGAIQVHSTPGQGTVFTLRFPLRAAPLGVAVAGTTVTPRSTPAVADMVDGAILLVEDEPAVQRALARMLQMLGQRVITAGDGEEGLARYHAHRHEIHAIVTDVRMPRMNGRLMADVVHAEDPAIPIVFVTGYTTDETLVKSSRESFVPKPLTSNRLAEAFAQLGVPLKMERRPLA
jgi:signal transduction histidine kinase/CheY-like chemotaxis protein